MMGHNLYLTQDHELRSRASYNEYVDRMFETLFSTQAVLHHDDFESCN
jgi:hypothetical protein